MNRLLGRLLRESTGQDLIEYALLAAFISLVAVAMIGPIGTTVNSWYEGYGATISSIPSAGS